MKLKLVNIILDLINILIKKRKVIDNRILFITIDDMMLSGDMLKIHKMLKNEYDTKVICYKYTKSSMLSNIQYLFNMIKQIYYIHQSKLIIINNNNYIVSRYKQKRNKVLQIWHATGAVKKFGNAIPRAYEVKNYDYILTCSDFWKEIYQEAFGADEKSIVVTGLPRIDEILKPIEPAEREKFHAQLPESSGKKIILYATTFRGDIYKGIKAPAFDFQYLEKALGEEYIILVKEHPLLEKERIRFSDSIIDASTYDISDLMRISDILISDYSSIIFEYALLNKPIIKYAYDEVAYGLDRGYAVQYDEIPGKKCNEMEEVINAIVKIKKVDYREHNSNYFKYHDTNNLTRIIALIKSIVDKEECD